MARATRNGPGREEEDARRSNGGQTGLCPVAVRARDPAYSPPRSLREERLREDVPRERDEDPREDRALERDRVRSTERVLGREGRADRARLRDGARLRTVEREGRSNDRGERWGCVRMRPVGEDREAFDRERVRTDSDRRERRADRSARFRGDGAARPMRPRGASSPGWDAERRRSSDPPDPRSRSDEERPLLRLRLPRSLVRLPRFRAPGSERPRDPLRPRSVRLRVPRSRSEREEPRSLRFVRGEGVARSRERGVRSGSVRERSGAVRSVRLRAPRSMLRPRSAAPERPMRPRFEGSAGRPRSARRASLRLASDRVAERAVRSSPDRVLRPMRPRSVLRASLVAPRAARAVCDADERDRSMPRPRVSPRGAGARPIPSAAERGDRSAMNRRSVETTL